jgi:hypothetical protein
VNGLRTSLSASQLPNGHLPNGQFRNGQLKNGRIHPHECPKHVTRPIDVDVTLPRPRSVAPPKPAVRSVAKSATLRPTQGRRKERHQCHHAMHAMHAMRGLPSSTPSSRRDADLWQESDSEPKFSTRVCYLVPSIPGHLTHVAPPGVTCLSRYSCQLLLYISPY